MTIASNISAALLIACAGMAHCAEPAYPTRPVRLLVGFPPGGSTDALARIITPRLGTAMGQNWIVDNRGGAGGNLASETAARATPDGHTVFLALSTQLTASPSLYKLPFSVEQDLQPITVLATHEHIVLVHPNVPVRTLKELITLAQQKPGALNYASSGVGGSLHLAAELLKRRAGFVAGAVPVLLGAVPSTLTFFTSGRLRALATTGAKRHKVTAELPTVAELGYPGFENIAWFGLFVPTSTPKSIVDRIRGESLKGLEHPDVQSTMGRLGLDRETSTPAELAARLKAETAQLAIVIREAGIRGE